MILLNHMCIFCEIVEGRSPATKRWSNDQWIVINDIHPKATTHVLLVSRKHIPSLDETSEEDAQLLGSVLPTIRQLAKDWSLVEGGYRVVNNCGKGAGQVVDHLHFHLMSGSILEVN